MSKGSIITLVVLIVALVGGMLVYKQVQRSRTEREAQAMPRAMLTQTAVYKNHGPYIDALLEEAHRDAFASSYRAGSLFSPSEWDEQVYLEAVIEHIAQRAAADGKQEILDNLPGVHGKPDG